MPLQHRKDIGAIALRFSPENAARGWETLDDADVPLLVRKLDDDLVYILSAAHWQNVQTALDRAGATYRYKTAKAGFSKQELEEPSAWREPSMATNRP